MELHSRLVHAEAGRRVVEVRATAGAQQLGSALAEAATAHEAEDLALARLQQRLQAEMVAEAPAPARPRALAELRRPDPAATRAAEQPSLLDRSVSERAGGESASSPAPSLPATEGRQQPSRLPAATATPDADGPGAAIGADTGANSSPAQAPAAAGAQAPHHPPADPWQSGDDGPPPQDASGGPAPAKADEQPEPLHPQQLQPEPQEEPPADPEDWSQELAALDLQLRRLGWGREAEGTYLQRAFGHPSRSRLTRYSDLRGYLTALEGLEKGSDPAMAAVPLRRSELLSQGDALLSQLGWSSEQGRSLLERELQRQSRSQLSDVQLLQFNMLLEGELLAAGASGGFQAAAADAAEPLEAQR